MARVKSGAGPLAVPGPRKNVSEADLEGLRLAGGDVSSQFLAGFALEHLPTLCLCSASPNPTSTAQTPCLRAFRKALGLEP